MKGEIELTEGELDLDATMRCGQTLCWNTVSGDPIFDGADKQQRYYTTVNGDIAILWQDDNGNLHFDSSNEDFGEEDVRDLLRLDDPIDDVHSAIEKDDTMSEAIEALRGVRLVKDDFVPCVLSYLCGSQQNLNETKELFDSLMSKYGAEIEHNGQTFQQFPSLYELSNLSERELRRMGLGYRAKYVKSAVRHIIKGKVSKQELLEMDYKEAHEEVQQINGVGDETADHVLQRSLGFLEAFPLDTPSLHAIQTHYPHHHEEDDYHATGDNLREYFGDYAGYAQKYLCHYVQQER